MRIFFRLHINETEVLEIDPETIRSMRIAESDEGTHYLSISNDSQEFIIMSGKLADCRSALDSIHNKLDAQFIAI
jgi:hypothetical protein